MYPRITVSDLEMQRIVKLNEFVGELTELSNKYSIRVSGLNYGAIVLDEMSTEASMYYSISIEDGVAEVHGTYCK